MPNIIPVEQIASKIYVIRGQKVMLDRDLAELYRVETRVLTQAVRRNIGRFPEDFMFELTWEEARALRSQIVILKDKRSKRGKHVKYRPCVFTEQGVAMLSSVLRSKKAVQVNIQIMRAFVRIRQYLATHKELAQKIADHDAKITFLFDRVGKIFKLLEKPRDRMKKITGFQPDVR